MIRRMKKLFKFGVGIVLTLAAALGAFYSVEGYSMYREALEAYPLEMMAADIRADAEYIELDRLPQRYLDAVIACEDHRFYQHAGVDLLAIGRALWHDVQALEFVEGGSTITQQLAKNQYFTLEKLIPRKVADALMALEMERRFSKDEILELYVNSIYFGEVYYGIGEASRGYFQKETEQLNDYECTMLAGIPNAPSAYTLTENPELAHRRQRAVVALMIKRGYLSPMEAEAIAAAGQQVLSWATSRRFEAELPSLHAA